MRTFLIEALVDSCGTEFQALSVHVGFAALDPGKDVHVFVSKGLWVPTRTHVYTYHDPLAPVHS